MTTKGITTLFASAETRETRQEEMTALSMRENGVMMNVEGKDYLVVPFKEVGKVVTCCIFENTGKFTDVWQAVPGQRVVMELA